MAVAIGWVVLWGAWEFAAPGMLGWAAAAVVPFLIHWLSRRRHRDMSWAAMQFLEAAWRKHGRRWRFEQWLVLLIRMTLVALLAVALAQPMTSRSSLPSLVRSRTLWILVLDESYSMGYKVGDTSLLDMARQQARQLVNSAGEGDAFLLMAMGKPPRVLISDPTFSRQDVLRELDALTGRDVVSDLGATLRQLRDVVPRAVRTRSPWDAIQVCLFSDLQATTWSALQSASLRDELARLAEVARIHVIDVSSGVWRNAGIVRLEPDRAVVLAGQDVRFVAECKRYSVDQPRSGQAMWLVDGQPVGVTNLDLVGPVTSFTFSHRFTSTGWHTVTVQAPELDPLAADNQRHYVVHVRPSLKVLCIEGQPAEGRFVAVALQPQQGVESYVEVETVGPTAIRQRDLMAYDTVFLLNVPTVSAAEAEVLRRYVRSGGGLIVCLGDLVNIANYHEHFVDVGGSERLLPARLQQRRHGQPTYVDPLGYQHPLVRPFEGHERSGLLTVPIRTYVQMEVFSEPSVRPILALDNGDTMLAEREYGQGRVLLLGTSVGGTSALTPDAWNDLAAWPSFVPLIHEMVLYATSAKHHTYSALVGEPLQGFLTVAQSATSVIVSTPLHTTERAAIQPTERSGDWFWYYADTWWSGLYRVTIGEEHAADAWFAVNVEPNEGDLTRWDASLLPSQINHGLPMVEQTESGAETVPMRSPWVKPMLAVVFALVLLDSLLGWVFGTARCSAATRSNVRG